MKTRTAIQQLADFSYRLSYEDLPSAVRDKAKICVLDALECCLSDMEDDRSRAALKSIRKRDEEPATLFGTPWRASAEDAAFYNTVKGALTSRNDSSRTAICHPGSILIPAVFALGEEIQAPGKAVLESLVCGYETMIRLGAAMVSAGINGAFRNTALVAPFGAAFSAAKIMGLSGEGIASAASFSCHFAGGLNEWAVAGTGEDVFQNGWGSRNGVLAMRLAKAGAKGCASILEGKSGMLAAFGAQKSEQVLTDGIGTRYDILDIMHKPIDSCFLVQGPSQTAEKLLRESGIRTLGPDAVESILIEVSAQAERYPGCNNTEAIGTLVQGIMSIALGVCSVLHGGTTVGIRWAPPVDPDILEMMHRCTLREDPEMTRAFPLLQGARVTVTLKDGRVLSAEQRDVRPLTHEEVLARFRKTAAERIGSGAMETVYEKVMELEKVGTISEITGLLQLK